MRERCGAAEAMIHAEAELAFFTSNGFSIDLEASVIRGLQEDGATAVFTGADLIALSIVRHAQKAGLNLPADLPVVGFDDIPWAQPNKPMLTTIEYQSKIWQPRRSSPNLPHR